MKKSPFKLTLTLAAAAVVAAALTACSQNAATNNAGASSPPASQTGAATPSASPSASASPSTKPDNSEALSEAFQAKIDAGASAEELNQLLDKTIPLVGPDAADKTIRAMLAYYDAHLESAGKPLEKDAIQQQLQKLEWPLTDDKLAAVTDKSARQAVDSLTAGGYKLEMAEGFIFPVVDYAKLKRFDANVSPSMKDYIALLATESDSKTASDGGLVIPFADLAKRAQTVEDYIRSYPDSPEKEAAVNRYVQYMYDYLIGLPNSQTYDRNTYKLEPAVQTVYEATIADRPDSVTAKMAQKWMDALQKTDGGSSDVKANVEAFSGSMEQDIRSLLEAANPNK